MSYVLPVTGEEGGVVARRPVAWVAAIVLLLEAVGIVFVNGVLATVVDNQRMSLAGLDPSAMSLGTWVMGGVFGAYLVLVAAVLVRTALRNRAPGRFGRIALIACAVVHGVLGAVTVGLVGWSAFAFMMVVLGLIVLVLVAYEPERVSADEGPAEEPAEGPAPA
ncbi:hypothetical protein ACFXKS_38895 [Streptomyces scopuliridis]|uniref:hypothetical protein n=1 Tax=Streptomyces scopuliridis TaxID=452529 RepID=UPI0036A6E677